MPQKTQIIADDVRRLRADGLSLSAIARNLRVAPSTLQRYIKEREDFRQAFADGSQIKSTKPAARRDENAGYEPYEQLYPKDFAVLDAIKTGARSFQAITAALNCDARFQLMPALERLQMRGRIRISANGILTEYELI